MVASYWQLKIEENVKKGVQKWPWIPARTFILHFSWVHLAKELRAAFPSVSRGGTRMIPVREIASHGNRGSASSWFAATKSVLPYRPGSAHAFDSVHGKCLILNVSKTWKLIAKERWNFEEKMVVELCDVASHIRYRPCHLYQWHLVQPCRVVTLADSAHLREIHSTLPNWPLVWG